MFSEYEVKKQICEIGKRIYMKGFVAANDGNISVKINDKEVLCTPTGISKGYMTPDMICKVDLDGKIISSNGNYKPSSEIKMHLRVYKERSDVKSVVHAHPPYGTSFAIAGIPLTKAIMPEAVIALGCVPIAEYGTPSTDEIPDAVSKYLSNYDAVLLENHGALTYGPDLMSAYFKMESLEFYAKLTYLSSQIGEPQILDKNQIEKLLDIRKNMNVIGKHPGHRCSDELCSLDKSNNKKDLIKENEIETMVREITKRVLGELK
ncbi:class II aldolase/adducin family protein [Clostridium fallax]|uniref:L-fuculose-phosphate aldolase n=1 Tax=Clostridium fallax TaxID=1533 RepID=A0A1M4XCH5_9CLOT|nr:class II aldolase/adducin family protein [Clostridium fallax]SHE91123.1 L-fuculose-phosphate aldolase [Clostridium fallax]SQB05982.1 class II aldolase/adducin family protein [Clostridium fallax]